MDIVSFLLSFVLGELWTACCIVVSPTLARWVNDLHGEGQSTVEIIARWWRNRRERG